MKIRLITSAVSMVALVGVMATPATVLAGSHADMIAKGKAVAFHRKKGNCLTCHMIPGGDSPGNVGPPLIAMKARFPNKQDLRDQIWDPQRKNPGSTMPPFGKHFILTEDEIDAVVEFIHSL